MGKASRNRNGTYDMGLTQINTTWVRYFSRYGVKQEHLMNDTCTNVNASAYILKRNWSLKSQDWFRAIVSYNIGPSNWTPKRYAIGHRYAADVVSLWWGFRNWVEKNGTPVTPASVPPAPEGRTAQTRDEAPSSAEPSFRQAPGPLSFAAPALTGPGEN